MFLPPRSAFPLWWSCLLSWPVAMSCSFATQSSSRTSVLSSPQGASWVAVAAVVLGQRWQLHRQPTLWTASSLSIHTHLRGMYVPKIKVTFYSTMLLINFSVRSGRYIDGLYTEWEEEEEVDDTEQVNFFLKLGVISIILSTTSPPPKKINNNNYRWVVAVLHCRPLPRAVAVLEATAVILHCKLTPWPQLLVLAFPPRNYS